MAGKFQVYGEQYVNLSITLTPEQRKQIKLKSVEYDVPIGVVARMALMDDRIWKQAVKQAKQDAKL